MRIKVIRLGIIISFLVIVLDLGYLQIIRGNYYYNLSKNNLVRVVHLEGWRGRIFDRNSILMADSRLAYNVLAIPQEMADDTALFAFLGEVLKTDSTEMMSRYKKRRLAPFAPVIIAEDISREQAIVIEENKFRFPGLLVEETFKRFYPLGDNSAHVLGYVGEVTRSRVERFQEYGYLPQSVIGYSGIEEYYDTYLRGEEGGIQIEVDSRGQQVRLLSFKEPEKGQDLTLTIDTDIQKIAQDVLEERMGAITVMDMDNGEILGLLSSPTYNPNYFVDSRYETERKSILKNSSSPLLNRAVKGAFPPGSAFKVSVAICGLDTKKITAQTSFDCRGYYEMGGGKFGCSHVHGTQNLLEAIAHSCNVYFYRVGLLVGADAIYRSAVTLGLGAPTHIDLPYESPGFIPNRQLGLMSKNRRWYTGDTLNLSIGQGDVLVTPLQLTRMMATVARDGVEVYPHIIKRIGEQDIDKYSFERKIRVDEKIFETVKKGLRATVTDYTGTAHVLDFRDLYVAGKTGTAQTSGEKENHAWFAGYAKGKRNIAFSIFLEHGGSSHNACLVARHLLEKMKEKGIL